MNSSMIQKLVDFNPKQRTEFYENLISMLAAEVEVCYPDGIRPGKEYDEALRKVQKIIRTKGRIHAFYSLNCRDVLVPRENKDRTEIDGTTDVEFLNELLDEMSQDIKTKRLVTDIIGNVMRRVTGSEVH